MSRYNHPHYAGLRKNEVTHVALADASVPAIMRAVRDVEHRKSSRLVDRAEVERLAHLWRNLRCWLTLNHPDPRTQVALTYSAYGSCYHETNKKATTWVILNHAGADVMRRHDYAECGWDMHEKPSWKLLIHTTQEAEHSLGRCVTRERTLYDGSVVLRVSPTFLSTLEQLVGVTPAKEKPALAIAALLLASTNRP